MLTNDLSRDAVLWSRQEGGEDRSSVGWQTRAATLVSVWCVSVYTYRGASTTDTGQAKGSSVAMHFFIW